MGKETSPERGKHDENMRYLSPFQVWALSFGCAVGWGAFVMPGTTFLPAAGPVGTAVGLVLGAVVMLVIGINYHCLMNRFPDAGGTLTYATKLFGYDHGFLSSWFLALVYIAIIWANATALTLLARYLLGDVLQFGFHYTILGYDVYLGEALLSMALVALAGFVCLANKRAAARVQLLMALILLGGVVICAAAVFGKASGGGNLAARFTPAFGSDGKNPVLQIAHIVALSPWAFVGFESVSQSTPEFNFSPKKSLRIMAFALGAGGLSYILLALMAAAIQPLPYGSWGAYIRVLHRMPGLAGLPAFFAANEALGSAGLLILGLAVAGGILTGLIGNYIAASRLFLSMSEYRILPKWFGETDKSGNPVHALAFLMVLSLPIAFLGRTAIGWIVDVNTIGATIAYGYTSAAAFVSGRQSGQRLPQVSGVLGIAMSILFFLYFMSWSAGAMSTESYLILCSWSILGFVFFRYVFSQDKERRFGKSTVVWLGLLFLIFFTSLMWVRQASTDIMEDVVSNVREYYESLEDESDIQLDENGEIILSQEAQDAERFMESQMERAERLQRRNSMIQMVFIIAALVIMFSIYMDMFRRQQAAEVEKTLAEESNRAKTIFLFNMSHDIRTPMNAIIGYTNLAKRENSSPEEMRSYLNKIEASSQHLLALINDVLEMSRIESGKMELELSKVDLRKTMWEVRDMFANQMEGKRIDFTVDIAQVRDAYVYCDKPHLNRVLLNLLSNAYKFTPEEGTVNVSLWQIDDVETGGGSASEESSFGRYELRVRDSGIGMTPEFAAKVFEAFERERTSTVSGIQGTGLGMSITKSIVDLMGGTIEVITAPNEGTEFVVRLNFRKAERSESEDTQESAEAEQTAAEPDFSKMHLLLVDDNEINREIAQMLLEDAGFSLDTAVNGRDAAEKVAVSQPGTYDAVLMDIQMPVMNGYEAARAIRSLANPALARVPIIAMTANAFAEDIKAAEDAGMDGHIAKPIDVEKMFGTLTEVLRKKR